GGIRFHVQRALQAVHHRQQRLDRVCHSVIAILLLLFTGPAARIFKLCLRPRQAVKQRVALRFHLLQFAFWSGHFPGHRRLSDALISVGRCRQFVLQIQLRVLCFLTVHFCHKQTLITLIHSEFCRRGARCRKPRSSYADNPFVSDRSLPATRTCRFPTARALRSAQSSAWREAHHPVRSPPLPLPASHRDKLRGVAQLSLSPPESSASPASVCDLPGPSPGWPRRPRKPSACLLQPPTPLAYKVARWNASGGRTRRVPAQFSAPVPCAWIPSSSRENSR